MNMIVNTTVRMTTSVPPKLRASSRRKVESNNIFCLLAAQRIMDFGQRITAPGSLASVEVDGLILVVVGDALDPALSAPIAALIGDAVAHGDLALKKGKSLYVHRPAGIAAGRVAVAVAADA